jgi:cobalamin biosynthesis protein CobC
MGDPAARSERAMALPITGAGMAESVHHGGDLERARQRFPDAPEPWLDLSTGINPIAYPLPDLQPDLWARLPERATEQDLIEAAKRRYGAASAECVTAAPGTQALIQLLPRLVAKSRVAVLGPTYDEHALCWRRQGHEVIVADSLASALGDRARVIVAVNPNNPTGRLLPVPELREAAGELEQRCGLLVVDEAFIDVLPASASLVSDMPAVAIVLRSFGKTYGLAGVRLGFAIAAPAIAAAIRAELGPWAVGAPPLAIGTRALSDDAWLDTACRRLTADQARLDRLLAAAGGRVIGGTPLFRLVEHAGAGDVVDRLGRAGIHVRTFDYAPAWIRCGLPGIEAHWLRLERALSG